MGTSSTLVAAICVLGISTISKPLNAQSKRKNAIDNAGVNGVKRNLSDTTDTDTMSTLTIHKERGAHFSGKGVGLTEILTETEFKKAACCTLSESFELSNTVEVSNADGVSGIKQVEMLGLAGKYVLM